MKMNKGRRKPPTDPLSETLKAFGMRAESVRIEVTSKNGENRSWALRLVLPDSTGTICCNEQLLGLGFESLSQPRLTRTLNLLLFDEVVTDPKRRLLRRIGRVSLRRTPSIREVRPLLKGKATVAELVRVLGQDSSDSDEQLFDRAVY